MNILVAEDDRLSRVLLSATLKKFGHAVLATENGREAWATLQCQHFPVLISDWMMPELDGLELCRLLRGEQRAKYTYIILLTSLEGKANYLAAMDAGADDFLTKPFDVDQLNARLRVAGRVLGLRERVTQLEGLLPICAYCKKIRDQRNSWVPVEQYIVARTDASFSHGICRECLETKVRPEMERCRKARHEAVSPGDHGQQ